jgi:hypothetical protein
MLFVSCSESTGPDENYIELKVKTPGLEVRNNMANKIYYFLVESEFVALIDWAPEFNGPFLEAYESIIIPFTEIANGKEESVKSGDRIICYWWKVTYNENYKLNYVSITL